MYNFHIASDIARNIETFRGQNEKANILPMTFSSVLFRP